MTTLARKIYGSLVPSAAYHGQIGGEDVVVDGEEKETLLIYVMSRMEGVSYLDFILSHNQLENSSEYFTWRKNLISDIAR